MTKLDFIAIADCAAEQLRHFLDVARHLKKQLKEAGRNEPILAGKTLAMIFEKPSTRTRVSFDVGARQMGGETLVLSGGEMQLGHGETVADTARVLSRYVDAIMIRALDQEMIEELAANATIPVINGLTKQTQPCQIMADVMTFEEHRGPIAGKLVAWMGDSNNVLASWVHAAARFNFRLNIATPPELAPPVGPDRERDRPPFRNR